LGAAEPNGQAKAKEHEAKLVEEIAEVEANAKNFAKRVSKA